MGLDLGWLDFTQIAFQLAACWGCYQYGMHRGVGETIGVLLLKDIIKEKDLDKLNE